MLRAVKASTTHAAVLDAGYGRHKLEALTPKKNGKPYLAGIGALAFMDLSGRGSESTPYGWRTLLRTPADFRARMEQLAASVTWKNSVTAPQQITL